LVAQGWTSADAEKEVDKQFPWAKPGMASYTGGGSFTAGPQGQQVWVNPGIAAQGAAQPGAVPPLPAAGSPLAPPTAQATPDRLPAPGTQFPAPPQQVPPQAGPTLSGWANPNTPESRRLQAALSQPSQPGINSDSMTQDQYLAPFIAAAQARNASQRVQSASMAGTLNARATGIQGMQAVGAGPQASAAASATWPGKGLPLPQSPLGEGFRTVAHPYTPGLALPSTTAPVPMPSQHQPSMGPSGGLVADRAAGKQAADQQAARRANLAKLRQMGAVANAENLQAVEAKGPALGPYEKTVAAQVAAQAAEQAAAVEADRRRLAQALAQKERDYDPMLAGLRGERFRPDTMSESERRALIGPTPRPLIDFARENITAIGQTLAYAPKRVGREIKEIVDFGKGGGFAAEGPLPYKEQLRRAKAAEELKKWDPQNVSAPRGLVAPVPTAARTPAAPVPPAVPVPLVPFSLASALTPLAGQPKAVPPTAPVATPAATAGLSRSLLPPGYRPAPSGAGTPAGPPPVPPTPEESAHAQWGLVPLKQRKPFEPTGTPAEKAAQRMALKKRTVTSLTAGALNVALEDIPELKGPVAKSKKQTLIAQGATALMQKYPDMTEDEAIKRAAIANGVFPEDLSSGGQLEKGIGKPGKTPSPMRPRP